LLVYMWGSTEWKILTDERFIFVSSRFRKVEIDFDVCFIVKPTNLSLISHS
jgi:hypothetical protein